MAISESSFLVKVVGVDGYWATMTGGDASASTSDVFNGGEREPEKLAGRPVTTDIVVDRPYNPATQAALLLDLRRRIARWRTTVSIQAIDDDDQPIGDPEVYSDALLVGVNSPKADASSGKEARFGLTFAVRGTA